MDIPSIVDQSTLTESDFKLASKNVKRKIKQIDKTPMAISNNCIANVPSSNSNKTYNLFLLNDKNNGIRFECDCGVQFGIERRQNCKHIATIIHSCTTNFFNAQINNVEKRSDKSNKTISKKRKHSDITKKSDEIDNVITAFENLFC